jgi:membrane-associated protein
MIDFSLEQLVETGRPLVERYGLLIVGLGVFGETLLFTGVAVPGFALLVTAGYFAAAGVFSFTEVALVGWLGGMAGIMSSYALGRYLGDHFFKGKRRLIHRLRVALGRQGRHFLLWYHYATLLRMTLPYVAGTAKYPLAPWVALNLPGTLVWSTLMLALGYMAHGALAETGNLIYLGILGVALVLTLWMSWRILRTVYSHEAGLDEPEDVPAPAAASTVSPN